VAQVTVLELGIGAETMGINSIAVIDSVKTIARIFRFIFPFSPFLFRRIQLRFTDI
jgi:hypothetical protein